MSTNVIPFKAECATPRHFMPACTVLTPELAEGLRQVNDMARRLRTAGIRVEAMSPMDVSLYIAAADERLFTENFRQEVRGMCWSTTGKHTEHSVYLGGVRIAWLVPVKEQDR